MLSKCANPACHAPFRYLRQGRIFNIERGTSSPSDGNSRLRRIEHFWLCEQCAQVFKLVVEDGVVAVRPQRLEPSGGRVDQEPGKGRSIA